MQTISFFSDIDTVFTEPAAQQNDYEKVAAFIQFSQPYMDNVYHSIVHQADSNVSIPFVVPMEFVYRQTYKQVDDLFRKIDALYESKATPEWYALLRQCSRLRATVSDICLVLRQLQAKENKPTRLTDQELRAWVEATVQHYGDGGKA